MNPRKQAVMLTAFDAFSSRVAKRYSEVRDCLAAGRFEEAQILLAALAASHAKTSMSLRGMLIREGLLEEDNK
jgi:hypothetical protein